MDNALELLEKTVVLIGQCSNTITYERRKNVLLGFTVTSSSQVTSVLKEKAAFLQKHDQVLFGKAKSTIRHSLENISETI